MLDHKTYFVGIDLGRTLHQVCVHDQDSQVAAHRTYRYLAEPVDWMLDLVNHQVENL